MEVNGGGFSQTPKASATAPDESEDIQQSEPCVEETNDDQWGDFADIRDQRDEAAQKDSLNQIPQETLQDNEFETNSPVEHQQHKQEQEQQQEEEEEEEEEGEKTTESIVPEIIRLIELEQFQALAQISDPPPTFLNSAHAAEEIIAYRIEKVAQSCGADGLAPAFLSQKAVADFEIAKKSLIKQCTSSGSSLAADEQSAASSLSLHKEKLHAHIRMIEQVFLGKGGHIIGKWQSLIEVIISESKTATKLLAALEAGHADDTTRQVAENVLYSKDLCAYLEGVLAMHEVGVVLAASSEFLLVNHCNSDFGRIIENMHKENSAFFAILERLDLHQVVCQNRTPLEISRLVELHRANLAEPCRRCVLTLAPLEADGLSSCFFQGSEYHTSSINLWLNRGDSRL